MHRADTLRPHRETRPVTGWQAIPNLGILPEAKPKGRPRNMLFLVDAQGLPLACSQPQAGQYNDRFDIQPLLSELCSALSAVEIRLEGLFLNADAGFDVLSLRSACQRLKIQANIRANPRNQALSQQYVYFDELLYQ